ncbi:helix-turn-helix domain-containing protein [Kitasatospora sp. NPDC057198]|uniref:helix-turn-helix domain-containing protein n=1 Tax=Kitasatospora sp. NPDC057198 TaxID=3346046 RepID=UPI0036276F88
MSTDYQRAREALGKRLHQLRGEAGLTGRQLAAALGWAHSKISKLENGQQTATAADLTAWAEATGQPGAAASLVADLRGLETNYQSWRRRLAKGHQPIQEAIRKAEQVVGHTRAYEPLTVPGLLQTPEYARAVFAANAVLHQSPRDTDAAVMERMRRQEALYQPGKRFEFIVSEAALRSLICPREAMVAQVYRLAGAIGLPNVSLGIIPFATQLTLGLRHSFWIQDDQYVTVETISAEQYLDSPTDVALYLRAWEMYQAVAVFGTEAHRLLSSVALLLAA